MTLEIKIAVALMAVYFAWSVYASIREIRAARRKRLYRPRVNYLSWVDPVIENMASALALEGSLHYSDFQRTEARACCTAVARAVNRWNIPYIDVSEDGRTIEKVILNYCPQCGKKIEKIKA